jgi:Sec-independent protein translocase protein TatA
MPENIELSAESMGKIKQAVNDFKNTLATYFKENSVEVKDWKFAVESSESSYIIDASVRIQIKPKNKTK